MKRFVLILAGFSILTIGSTKLNAQDLKTEVYVKEHIPNKKPVPYPYVREADVMWSKTLWRIIDLRQKQNLPLYYPLKPIGKRMSLIDLLLYGIDNEGLTAYSPDDPYNEFKVQLTKDIVDFNLGAGIDTVQVIDPNTGEVTYTPVQQERRTEEVKQLLVKEKWYFDRKHSVMKVRILGLCPIRVYNRLGEDGLPTEEVMKKKVFWVYFPEARPLLSRYEIYNRHNDAQRLSFDDYFWQRRFNSYIYAESNVYSNRLIEEYTLGLETLMESERIKESLFNMEHDLWEY
jgi:gliding motility associated protien GldN